MGTPQNEKAKRPPEPMKFELPEIQGPSFAQFKMRDIFDNIVEMELRSTGDAADTNSELKEAAKKIEDKLFQEEIASPPLPKARSSWEGPRDLPRTSFLLKKQLSRRPRYAGMLPPLAPKKILTSHAQDDLQKEATIMEPQDVPGNIGEHGEGRSHDLHKEPEVQLKKSQDVPGTIGERGEGRSNDPHKQPEVPKIMESKGFKDAPSFDLGIDIPSKSTGSITESMLEAAYNKAMKKTEQRTEQMVDKPEEDFILKHVPRQLKDDLYREICKYKYFNPKSDTSPPIFQSDDIVVTARELANCVHMGRSIDTKLMQAGTFVLSQDPSLKKKQIMSHWVGMQMMSAEGMYGKSVEKAFTFKVEDYDMIVFPIWQELSKEPQAVGHWFTVVQKSELN